MNHTPSHPDRRRMLKAVGLGAGAALASAALPSTVAAAPGTTRVAAPGAGRERAVMPGVVLWINVDNVPVHEGGGTTTVHVGNSGAVDATPGTTVDVYLITPFWVNFDPSTIPTQYPAEYIVNNPAPNIPEMIRVRIPAAELAVGQQISFQIGLSLVEGPGAPQFVDRFLGHVVADGTQELVTCACFASIGVDLAPMPPLPPGSNEVNLFFSSTRARVKPNLTARLQLHLGNMGPKTPSAPPVLTFVSPFASKIDRTNAAFKALNPTYLHDIADPRVPDMVTIPIPVLKLLPDPTGLIDVLDLFSVTFPLKAITGAVPTREGKAMLHVTGANDIDPNPAVGFGTAGLIQP